jgi:uncharacterized protein (TIGR03085 family)
VASLARAERSVLADLLAQVGPEHPTLCAGWVTRDLAAHLVVRERRPDAAPGIVVPGWNRWTDRVTRSLSRTAGYAELVRKVREGPPPWMPLGFPAADDALNLLEMYVHTEDIRRASPGWKPRSLPPALEDALWRRLRATARALFRRATVGVLLRRADAAGQLTAHAGEPSVTLAGKPSELVLYAYGRKAHAVVEVHGEPRAVAAFTTTPLDV